MKAEDIRNATWSDIQGRLEGDRLAVYEALRRGGPATTRELAARMGWDLNSVAPRVTELGQLGLVQLAGRHGRSGRYEAVHMEEARAAWQAARRGGGEQLLMGV